MVLLCSLCADDYSGSPAEETVIDAEMTTATARLARDPEGRIVRFVSAATEATFGYDDGSLVARFERRSGAEK